ncbi:hypothetical protein K488DRAFT_86558 [Vararia minispora EC-137]|uniref:Uncharacterized protein n=1 Tax=Vararia minispora EC-137 TaxID=1314806 RepID=A0ACB8QJ54_9AGAM|nr:hypothetical protein K488DRAFT_86558 [Vararia minispora EC-137]
MRTLLVTAALLSTARGRRGAGEGAAAAPSTSASVSAQTSSTSSLPPTSSTSSSSSSATSSTASSTSSQSSPQPSPSTPALLTFDSPANATTCGDTSFAWSTQGVPSNTSLTLQVMRGNMTMRVLGTNVPVTASRIDWHTVDVGAGTYTVRAFDSNHTTGLLAQSAPFNVADGADRSCLQADALPSQIPGNGAGANSTPNPTNRALVIAACFVSAAVLVFALAAGAYVYRRYYWRQRHRRRQGGPRYLF